MDIDEDIDLGPGLPHRIVEATAQPLYLNPIVAIVLCKFSGSKPVRGPGDEAPLVCQDRAFMRHPDEECLTYYFMLDASMTSVREVLTHMSAPIVTVVDGDLTFRDIL